MPVRDSLGDGRWRHTRGDSGDGGLDLDGLDAVIARQPKKSNSAPSTVAASSTKSRRAGGDEPRVGLRKRALRRGRRRSPRRADRSSTLRPFVRSSSGGRHVKRRRGAAGQNFRFLDSSWRRRFFTPGGGPLAIFFRGQVRSSASAGRWRGHDDRRTVGWVYYPIFYWKYATRAVGSELSGGACLVMKCAGTQV